MGRQTAGRRVGATDTVLQLQDRAGTVRPPRRLAQRLFDHYKLRFPVLVPHGIGRIVKPGLDHGGRRMVCSSPRTYQFFVLPGFLSTLCHRLPTQGADSPCRTASRPASPCITSSHLAVTSQYGSFPCPWYFARGVL